MSLINVTINTIFPYVTNQNLLDIQSLFAQGTWINIPSYKASWVSFGDISSTIVENIPKNFGSVITNSVVNEFVVESSNLQYEEELNFDIRPNNVENNVKVMRSAYCIFQSPYYSVNRATKVLSGLTSGSTGVNLTTDLGNIESFQFSFSGDVSSITANTADFNFNIYRYNEPFNSFLKPEFIRKTIDYGIYGLTLTFDTQLDLTNFVDHEYLIKAGYSYTNCTPGAKLLGIKTNTLDAINPLVGYVDYNPSQDWYFVYTLQALAPEVKSLSSQPQLTGVFNVESLAVILTGVTGTTYYPTQPASGDYLVHVNGVTLIKGVEYVSGPDYFTLLVSLSSTDVLTIAYVANSNNGTSSLVSSENYTVSTPIPSGTSISVGQKLIYNTSTGRYEYWLDTEPSADVVFLRNGVQQSTAEYIVSSTNKRRVILFFTPVQNDIIEVFYAAVVPGTQNIANKNIEIVFTIPIAPSEVNGYFSIDFYDKTDTSLSTPLFNQTIDYIVGQNSYLATILVPTIYGVGQEFLWQITNTKNFVLKFGSGTITTTAKSGVYNAILTTNENNNY